jgi:dihydroorotate dehydrogenase (fumarate)
MDLTTTYLGKKLKSPLVVSATPLTEDIGNIKKMEDAGAGAVVLHSLFEEQIRQEQYDIEMGTAAGSYSSAEVMSYFPEPDEYRLSTDEYLEQIRKAKQAVNIPIIASLNGSSMGGWTEYAKKMQDAGADALELNIYWIPTKMDMSGCDVEKIYIDIIKSVKSTVNIPVSIKLSPFFSNMANMARRLDDAGADGLVLFNRFYQPDIDLETLEVKPKIELSHSFTYRLPLTWIALLFGRITADLAATRGLHHGKDIIKMLMAGAKVTQLCSVLLKNGIDHIKVIEKEMVDWMTEKEYVSVKQMQGSMSHIRTQDRTAWERAQYIKALTEYKYQIV